MISVEKIYVQVRDKDESFVFTESIVNVQSANSDFFRLRVKDRRGEKKRWVER